MTAALPRLLALTLPWLAAAPAAAQDARWVPGPIVAELGDLARVEVGAGDSFLDGAGTLELLRGMGQPVSGDVLGTIRSDEPGADWWIVFRFDGLGYVPDDGELDPDALLESLQADIERTNERRRQRGWAEIEITGWEIPPRYDARTKRLEWAVRTVGEGIDQIELETRVLGRRGVLEVELVARPEQRSALVEALRARLDGLAFLPGERHEDRVAGDPLATGGLAELVAGGELQTTRKGYWKIGVVAALALGGWLRLRRGARGTAG